MAEEDIISTLPDAIICHILSFLQTKHAVATSVLSTRWKHLYLSVPVLYFDTTVTNQNEYTHFIDFLYSVLLSRDPALPIKTFYLDFTFQDDEIFYPRSSTDTIIKWIKFVAQRGVEYIDLRVVLDEIASITKLPITILKCSTLVVLKLIGFNVEEGFSPIALPSLKTLDLDNIWFGKLRDFMLFLNECPLLEDLTTFFVKFNSDESLTCDEWKSFRLTNLTRASIDCFRSYFPLKAIHNVASLRFEIDQVNYRNDSIPTFHNLTRLEFVCSSLHYNWKFLVEILNHCPKLQKLDLDETYKGEERWTRKDDKENWVDPDFVPQCLSLHLRTCNLFNFSGLQGDLLLARYILKNARVLQTMKIWKCRNSKIYRLLSSSPTASPTCKLTVYRFKQTTEKNDDDDDDDNDGNDDEDEDDGDEEDDDDDDDDDNDGNDDEDDGDEEDDDDDDDDEEDDDDDDDEDML